MIERAAIETLLKDAYAARVQGDLDKVMTYFHPECRFHLMGAPDVAPACNPQTGCDAVRAHMAGLIGTFAFSKFEMLGLIVEGERVAHHWRADVTFVPTGKTQNFEAFDMITFEDGKVRSLTQFTDTASVMRLSLS
ncbi:MAG TPA: nuclear transport factor 2 family protein [Bosea sp. (in: a-proteobacteria)]|jgi:ketosteroid isomerase-like protein|uniref:nuclear transport factor 2 family protein n=1 Tax=Bosea sp. (in: a-proteobacteria) TaxID=1871050 RepID=UPI002E1099F6|nr:nuclear transport factor 2 family protein [Bosea sp. (in: a-proteobacteria)]